MLFEVDEECCSLPPLQKVEPATVGDAKNFLNMKIFNEDWFYIKELQRRLSNVWTDEQSK